MTKLQRLTVMVACSVVAMVATAAIVAAAIDEARGYDR